MHRDFSIPVTLALVLAAAGCSGSGVSTTARTDDGMGDGMAADTGDDGGSTPAADDDGGSDPSAADDAGTSGATDPTADDGGSDPSADDGSSDPSAADAGDDGPPEEITISGTWLSEGSDVAPLLVELTGAQQITAVFADGTFTVATVDDQGQEVVQAGVYTATPSGVGDIFEIVLEQSSPATVTAEGIFEIDTSVSPAIMRYEIVQTEPSVGAVPPTADGGFGSTAYGDDLTQIYVRQ